MVPAGPRGVLLGQPMKFGYRSFRPGGDFTKCSDPTLDGMFGAWVCVVDTSREGAYSMEDGLPVQGKGEAGEVLPPGRQFFH